MWDPSQFARCYCCALLYKHNPQAKEIVNESEKAVKRQLKNIVDNNHNLFSNGYYYIIMVKKDIIDLSYQEKEKYLLELLNKENTDEK